MRTYAKVQAALVDSLARDICEGIDESGYVSPSMLLMNTLIAGWMIEMNVRFCPGPTELENSEEKS
jgi:hypothetical protein